jgi:hypothetical protein
MNPIAKERRRSEKIKVRLLVLWIVIFTVAVGYNFRRLNEEDNINANLLEQIQESRVESCVRTYTVIQAILDEAGTNPKIDAIGRARLSRMREFANPDNCEAQVSIEKIDMEG